MAGAMCPSYRATRDEQHVTRGRANSLRLAISGQLGPDAFTSPEMKETLDLCVSCKACRRECPTGVDMARMKIEFLHHYHARHGLPLRERLIAHLPRYAPVAARLAPLLNLRDRIGPVARATERWLGLSARRTLPRWRRPWTPSGRRGHVRRRFGGDGRDLVLFGDTFNRYYERENLEAAERVLAAAGYRLHRVEPRRRRPAALLRPHLPVGRPRRRGAAGGPPHARRARALRRAGRAGRRARALLPPHLPRRVRGAPAQGRGRAARRRPPSSWRRRSRPISPPAA